MDITRELCRFGHQEVSGKTAYCLGMGDGPCFHFVSMVPVDCRSQCAFPIFNPFIPPKCQRENVERKYRKE